LSGDERNGVFEVAVAQLSLLRPELIVSIGDLIEGGTEDRDQLRTEWTSFDEHAGKATAPIFYVGGNHDLTIHTTREVWAERYGARYYHFVYKDVLFLILDTEDYADERMREVFAARAAFMEVLQGRAAGNLAEMAYTQMPERLTGEIGAEQSAYMKKVIADNPDVRWTLLFMHKPVWRRDDESDFAAIEEVLSERPYTVFNGHFHTYSHTVKHDRDYITLGTTGGTQFPEQALSIDHLTLVTLSEEGPPIANLRMEGIFDKTGDLPLNGDDMCFTPARCPSDGD
jgi:3',5'-cyclic AMP phosphodiesterase CpdA